MTDVQLDISMTPKQEQWWQVIHAEGPYQGCLKANEILLGGALFGSKSAFMRILAAVYAVANPGIKICLMRETYSEVVDNHLSGDFSLDAMTQPLQKAGLCRVTYGGNAQTPQIKFKNGGPDQNEWSGGSVIQLHHLATEKALRKHQGLEFAMYLFDEAPNFIMQEDYEFLRTRNRIGRWKPNPMFADNLPMMVSSGNPTGKGLAFYRDQFVKANAPNEVWVTRPAQGRMRRVYLPSRASDNPFVTEDYLNKVKAQGDPILVQKMLDGDWNVIQGGAFTEQWNPERVILPDTSIPTDWWVGRVMDWGSAAPCVVGYMAISPGDTLGDRYIPAGSTVFFSELYLGQADKPDEGLNLTTGQLCDRIRAHESLILSEKIYEGTIRAHAGDSNLFAREGSGQTIGDELSRAGVRFIKPKKGPTSRVQGLALMRRLLKDAGDREKPGLYFMERCRYCISTIPSLPMDKNNPEDINTKANDHCYDMVRLGIYTPRARARVENVRL